MNTITPTISLLNYSEGIARSSGKRQESGFAKRAGFLTLFFMMMALGNLFAQAIGGPLVVTTDPNCSSHCCSPTIPCNCSAGVLISGGFPPYIIFVTGTSGIVGQSACVTGLCPGTYTFEVRDQGSGGSVFHQVTVGGSCCSLVCRDTVFCFNVPDSLIVLNPPSFSDTSGGGAGTGTGPGGCAYDSIYSNAPGIYPVGTTVVKWYVHKPDGSIDSCSQNVIRNPPSVYNISFTTSPPIVGGVINICNGQSITFNDNSTGITGLLWNFGNGYYSSNSNHTEPASHYPPGTYYDTLTVFDDCGTPHDTAFQVVVDSASGPDITCISVVCPGDTVTYHTNVNCTNYVWSVTGGVFAPTPAPTSDSCTVVWGPGPQGTISLSVSGCTPPVTCAVATTKTVNIVPATLPVAGDTVLCAGATATYCIECIPGNEHSWEMMPANAGTITGQNTCCVTVHFNPNFFGTVSLTVNYHNVLTGTGCNLPSNCTQDPGCGGSGVINITVKPIFGINGPAKVCPGVISSPFAGMNLTSNTAEPLTTWKLVTPSLAPLFFGTTAALNAYTWNAGPGIYNLTAYAPAGVYCNDSAIVQVEVVNVVVPNVITGPDTVCANQPFFFSTIPNMTGVTYTWNVTGGTLIPPTNGSSVAISWNPGGGTVSVYQTLTAAPGCVSGSSATFTVKTWPAFPLPTITSSQPIVCLKSTVTYSIPLPLISNGSYTWSVVPSTAGNIMTANGTNTISIKWVDASITPIYVKLKINRCYEDSVMLPINLLALPPVPSINYTPADPCVNVPVQFTTTSLGPLWNWDFGDASTSTIQNPIHSYINGGDFTIQLYVTNANGCSDTAYSKIHIDTLPAVPTIVGNPLVCLDATENYSFSEPLFMGAAYTWSLSAPALGNVVSSGQNFMNIKWTTPGIDTVKIHLQSTCLDTTIRFVVKVNPLPTPSISLPSPSCIGSPLTFTGSGGVTYNWSFGGGSPSTSTSATPVVTYGSPGSYAVSLSVVDANGCTASTNTTLAVHGLPLALITGPARICSFPATVTLSAVNLAGYSFAWTPSGSTPTITPTINSQTAFSCVVTNAFGCTQTSNTLILDTTSCPTIIPPGCHPNDTINFVESPPVCLTQQYTSVGTASLVGWDFGDGGTAGPISPVSHTFAFPGIYQITVYGSSTGIDSLGNVCIDTIFKFRNVVIPFDVHFDYSYQCNGSNVMQAVFANTSLYLGNATSYNWTWVDLTTATTIATVPFPGPITLTPGVHVISVTAFDPATGATCTETKTLTVPSPIVAAFNVSTPICQGTAALFTDFSFNLANESSRLFNNGNGTTSIASPASLIYANSGPFTATLTVSDIYGCSSTASQNVSVLPAGTGTITVGAGSCDSVQLTASGPGPFTWQVINPPPFPTNPVYVHTSGFYSVIGVGANGCPYKAGPVQVTVKRSPTATISGKTVYCQGEKLDLKTTSAGTSFVWQQIVPFAGVVGTNAPNLNITANTPGTITYSVTVTGANGCSSSASITITVDPVPSSAYIDSSSSLTFCEGDSVLLTVVPPGASYLWSKSPTPALTSPADSNDSLWVSVTGVYSVIVQTINGCAYPAITPVNVTVNPKPVANITGDTVMCEGDQLTLQTTPVGGGTYSWVGPIGTGNTNPFVLPNMTLGDGGVYTVTVTNSYGCTQTDNITVIVNPAPVTPFITSNPGGVLCEGALVTFNATPVPVFPVVYTWSTGQNGPSITAAMAGNYYVVATNQFGCSATSNILTIHPLPDLSCVPSGCYDFCNECDSVTIPGPVGFASYMWQTLVGNVWVNYSNTQNLTILPPGGMYRLLASNMWGCADSSDTLKIEFHDCCTPITTSIECVDTTCQDFSDNLLHNFQPYVLAPNVVVALNNVGGQYPGDIFIQATDLAGPSGVQTDTSFLGKWCCGKFSYDFKIFDDGQAGSPAIAPRFRIFNSVLNKGFLFTANFTMTETSGWKKIVACGGLDSLPQNTSQGTWTPIAPAVLSDWQAVASNVTDVVIGTQVTNSGEVVGIDNVCYTPQQFSISCKKTKVCGGYIVSAEISDTSACNTFHYEWSNGSHEPFLELPPPGTYCVKISNCCGCIDSCCITIPPDTNIIVVTDTVYHINCDSLYGGIALRVSGGIPPYHYQWSNGNTTESMFNLPAGAYSIIITDSTGCDKVVHDTVTVQGDCNCNSNPPPPLPTITVLGVVADSCNQSGCINLAFTGCCLRYGYSYHSLCSATMTDSVSWTKDSTIFCHLRAGTYTIYVSDPCGNIVSQNVFVPSVSPPLMTWVTYANCGAQICVGAEGGCGPYTYQWSNGETTACIHQSQPCVDLTVTITDAYGCSQTIVVSPPDVNFVNVVKPTCCASNGSLCATVCFGPQPYSYLWSTGDTGLCISGVPAGTYCLTITNANGQTTTCCYTLPNAPVSVPNVHFAFDNCGSIVNAIIDSTDCPGATYYWNNGSTSLMYEGVHPCDSLTFTVVTCDGAVHHFGFTVPGIFGSIQPVDCITGLGTICVQTECFRCAPYTYTWTPAIAGNPSDTNCIHVPSGIYNLCITNACGDVICCSYYLPPLDSSHIIIVTDTVYNIDCDHPSGGIDINPTGGYPPYTYQWSTGAITQDVSGLVAGNYSVIVTDSVGCNTIVHDTVVVNSSCDCNTLPEPILPTITVLSVDPDMCTNNGCIHATFTGCCLWFSYSYFNPCNPALSFSVPQTRDSTIFCNLPAGTYTIFVQDGCGNMVQQTVVVPSANPPLSVSIEYGLCGRYVCANAVGGCPPYSYSWIGGGTQPCMFGLPPCTMTQVVVTDAKGCSVTIDVVVPGATFTNVVQPSCCLANGSICVNACFGPQPYTYVWSNGATSACIQGLNAGTYCVTITNGDGQQFECCYDLIELPVTPPTVHFVFDNCGETVHAVFEEIVCENFTGHWENGVVGPVHGNLTNCDSVTYTLVACDGTEYNFGFRVPHLTATIDSVDCVTGLGSICVETDCFRCAPYTYSWTPAIAGNISDSNCIQVPSGIYNLCITNSCGDVICCSYYLPPLDSSHIIVVTDTVYNIDCDHPGGGIDINPTGGHPPYTYQWSTGAITQNVSGLAEGVYSVTVTDSVGCSTTVHDTVFVNNVCDCVANPPTITIIEVEPDVCTSNGCIHATFTGCCLWFSYSYYNPCNPLLSFSVPQTRDSSIFCNLAAGLYTIYVMDACGNLIQQNVNVPSANPPLSVSLEFGSCGSYVCANATGGCAPYTYSWIGGNTTPCMYGLTPCTVTEVTVTDAKGCSITKTVYVPGITFSNVVQPTCCLANGSICATACFGPQPYTYHWSNGATTECLEGLIPGTYCVTVTNAFGEQVECCYDLTGGGTVTPPDVHFVYDNCGGVVTAVFNEFACENFTWHWENGNTGLTRPNLTACDSITFTIVTCDGTEYHHGFRVPAILPAISPVNCATGLGSICLDVMCFRCPPYTYSWSPSQPVSQTGNCFMLPPGQYNVCITNACGDVICCNVILPPVFTTIDVTADVTDVLCFGQNNGTVTVSATGGTAPYTGIGTFNVGAGTHTFTVVDANGCSGSVTVHVNEPSELYVNAFPTAILCHGGTSQVTVTAGGGTPPYVGTGVFTVQAGYHTFTVTDANGCITTTTIYIPDPPAIQVGYSFTPIPCYGGVSEVTISAGGGTGPYSGTGVFTEHAGEYTYVVTDANGCVGTVTINIPQPPKVEGTTSSTPSLCGSSNGTASVVATGGIPGYSYMWMPGGQTTSTATNLAAGPYVVTITDSHGCTGTATVQVGTTGTGPDTPGPITGPKGACRNTSGIVYSIAAVPGATSYIWTLPAGVTGSSTTNTITLSFSNSYAGGFICVAAQNPCGISAQSCMSIPVITTYPAVPNPISGPVIICGPTTAVYSTTSFNALSYNWTVTGGGTIVSGQGTNSIVVSIPAGFTQGAVQVTATNCYSSSAVRGLLITGIPAHSYSVTGPTYMCANTSATYSMPLVTGATSYVWSVTGDATLGTMTVGGTGVTQVINFGPAWTSGTVSVSAVNACGSYTKSFVVRSTPVQPGSVSGPTTGLCNTTATYTVAAVATATSYQWTVPAGATISGSSTGSTVTIVFGPSFTSASANICVSAVNSCGAGPQRCFAISSRPGTPVVTGPSSVCKSQSAVAYSVAPVSGAASYAWQVTGGATITPSGLNATVNYNTATISSVIVRATGVNSCGSGNPGLLNVAVSLACRMSDTQIPLSTFEVFPNPTSGQLNVKVDAELNGKCLVKISDLLGNVLVKQESLLLKGGNTIEFDLADFAEGMYFLTIEGDRLESRTVRIIVE